MPMDDPDGTRPFKARQINDVNPENLADTLMILASEGYAEWVIIPQEEETKYLYPSGQRVTKLGESYRVVLYRVLAWTLEGFDGRD